VIVLIEKIIHACPSKSYLEPFKIKHTSALNLWQWIGRSHLWDSTVFMKAADKLSKKEAWPFDQRPRPILAHEEQCQLFVTIGALVAFAFAAGGAILVLATFRATRARSLDRCNRRHEGESDSSDE